MTIKEFIEKAIEGGYRDIGQCEHGCHCGAMNVECDYMFLLDPKAWQAVGKSCDECKGEGIYADHYSPIEHGEYGECIDCPAQVQCEKCEGRSWKDKMRGMTDALIEGKSIKSFLKTL